MFYLEAQSKVGQSPLKDEIQQGEVVIGASSGGSASAANAGTKNGGHRRKRSGR